MSERADDWIAFAREDLRMAKVASVSPLTL